VRISAAGKEDKMESPHVEYTAELLRHFADLRDGTHGGAVRRQDKERFFSAAVALLDSHARQALDEINTDLLLGTGEVTATGVRRRSGGVEAIWALSWPEQRAAGISPIAIRAYYSAGAHHPHLQGGTTGDWPLNVSTRGRQRQSCLPCVRWRRPAGHWLRSGCPARSQAAPCRTHKPCRATPRPQPGARQHTSGAQAPVPAKPQIKLCDTVTGTTGRYTRPPGHAGPLPGFVDRR
jgi:hypothetical protein